MKDNSLPAVVMGAVRGNHGVKWELRDGKYVSDNPGKCKAVLSVEEMYHDLRLRYLIVTSTYTRFRIGIDIGKQGAIAIWENGEIHTHKMPMIKTELDYHKLYNLLEKYEAGNGKVVFEKLGVIFGSSKTTAFSMGHQAGAIEMLCVALSIPFVKVPAKMWQKEMFVGVDEITKPAGKTSKTGKPVRDTKAMALVAVKRLLPNQELTLGDRAVKPHDGLVDALLMMEYAKKL